MDSRAAGLRRAYAQGLVEYGLIIALVSVLAIGGAVVLGPAIPYLLDCLSVLL